MDDSATRALGRLQDPQGKALAELAAMVVEQTTATPVRAIARPEWIAHQVAAGLEAATHGDHLRQWVDARYAAERDRWGAEDRTLRGFVPEEALEPLQSLLGRPYAPDEELVYRLIDQGAIRELVHTVLSQTVSGFRKRLGDVDGMIAGLSRRAAKRGRGLLGNLGGMAENIVGAVREEVDHALEHRVADFMEGATTQALRTIADYIADPAQAEGLAQMRLAVLDVVLDSPIRELAAEADKLSPEEVVDVVVGAIRSSLAEPDFVEKLQGRIAATLEEAGDQTFGDWLTEVGLADVWTQTTTELVADRLTAVVRTDRFEAWFKELHR